MQRTAPIDRWLFGATLALCLAGAVMVFSASAPVAREQAGNPYTFLWRQLVWLLLGFAGMFWLMTVDYRRLRRPVVIFTALCLVVVLLLGVLFLTKAHATHRWIRLGPVSVQPAEIAKLAIVLYLAWFLERRRRPGSFGVNDPVRTIAPALGPVVVLMGLVVIEPDMGTAFELLLIALVMLYIAGLSPRYLLAAAAVAFPAAYLLIIRVPYRYERVMAFLHPSADPRGHGFQLMQSLIAVGSGGPFGVGLMESRQKLFYLPEAHTDFIFAVLCEELGLIAAAIILTLFAVYAWRGFRAALLAQDDFGRLAAAGITTMVLAQALINVSVVIGLMPTKGLPLPFMSYGGSSLLAMLLATGVLLNISQQATSQ